MRKHDELAMKTGISILKWGMHLAVAKRIMSWLASWFYRKRPAAKIPGGCLKLERLNSLLPTHHCQFCQDSPITQVTIFLGLSENKFARNLVVSVSPSQVQAQRPVCHRRSRTLERGGRVARPGTQSHQHVFSQNKCD